MVFPVNRRRYERGNWRFEPKVNGWRSLVDDRTGAMYNRHGALLPVEATGEFEEAHAKLKGAGGVRPWWDCLALDRRNEAGRGALILLDALLQETDHLGRYTGRRSVLTTWSEPFDWQSPDLRSGRLYHLPSWDFADAITFWEIAPTINALLGFDFYDGVVAKRYDSYYKYQTRSDKEESMDWFKHRFTSQ